jgi:hypothetical protein
MKRLIALVVIVAGLALPAATNAAATTDTVSFETIITDCNLNRIQLNGSLLIIATTTLTPSGGFASTIHSQPLNIRGVGLDTGTSYIGTGLTRDTFIALPSGGLVLTFVNKFQIQGTAGADSFGVSQLLPIPVTGGGTVTAFVDNFSTSC